MSNTTTPLGHAHRYLKRARCAARDLALRIAAAQRQHNLAARALRDLNCPFRPAVVKSRKRPSRHPRHRLRALEALMT